MDNFTLSQNKSEKPDKLEKPDITSNLQYNSELTSISPTLQNLATKIT